MKLRDLCLMAVLGVVMFVSQVALAFLPNIELVSLFVILFTLVFRKRVVGALGVFILLEGLVYGFGFWWLNYLYVWPLLALLTYMFRWMTKSWQWAVFSGLYGLAFGTFCSLAYLSIGGIPMMISWIISGFPFDIAHAVGNFILAFLLYRKLRQLLEKLDHGLLRLGNSAH